MAAISDVYIIDVTDNVEHRKTKHCICISVAKNKCLLINTENRGIYNELEISSENYNFLNGKNRFVACSRPIIFKESEIIKKEGNINYNDMAKILEKLKSVKKKDIAIQLKDVITELEEWLANYSGNKLADVFNKR
jgi:hypothetical protein